MQIGIGKRIMRIRVIDSNGLKQQPSQAVIRNILRVVDMMPAFYLLGGVVSVFSKYSQWLGDIAASTIVVRLPKLSIPDLSAVLDEKYNSFRAYPHLEAQLRQRIQPDEIELAVDALYRRERLETHARMELFKELANIFKTRVKFPDEIIEFMSNERYVLNCIDSVYRTIDMSREVTS